MSAVIGQVPLFPLPHGALLPGELLPLRIFEPRYRRMMEDVRGDEGLIAIATQLGSWAGAGEGGPPVADIVGVGRVVKDRLRTDGTSDIVLHGLSRGRITEELQAEPYRRARVLLDAAREPHPAVAFRLRRFLLQGLASHLGGRRLLFDVTAPFQAGVLADRIASALALSPEHRVAMLQALDEERRVHLLLALLGEDRHRGRLATLVPSLSDFALFLADAAP